jgi:hypothetical protein
MKDKGDRQRLCKRLQRGHPGLCWIQPRGQLGQHRTEDTTGFYRVKKADRITHTKDQEGRQD